MDCNVVLILRDDLIIKYNACADTVHKTAPGSFGYMQLPCLLIVCSLRVRLSGRLCLTLKRKTTTNGKLASPRGRTGGGAGWQVWQAGFFALSIERAV